MSRHASIPISPHRPEAATPGARRLSPLRRLLPMAVGLIGVVVALSLLTASDRLAHASPEDQRFIWLACSTMLALIVALLLLSRHAMLRALEQLERQVRRITADGAAPPLSPATAPAELRPAINALSQWVEQIQGRVDRLGLQRKELDIQMRVAEAERRHTEAIIFSISDAVLVIDAFGEIALANAAAESLLGIRLAEARHRPVSELAIDPALRQLIEDARSSDWTGTRRRSEHTIASDARELVLSVTISRVVDDQGHPHGVVVVFHDITREREIAQAKTDFVSAVSHELRTPLASIRAYIEMLADNEAPDEQTRQDFYKIIEAETERLQRLISNILNLARIESGLFEAERQRADLNGIVRDVLDAITPQAAENGLTIEARLSPEPCLSDVDRDLLHQAVLNLVSNAVKYTGHGGRVTVETRHEPGAREFVVSVRDTGIGIRPQDLPHVFEKFYRSREGAAVARGTGLGLSLVQHIIERVHGGLINVSSQHGAGTDVTLTLPIEGRPEGRDN